MPRATDPRAFPISRWEYLVLFALATGVASAAYAYVLAALRDGYIHSIQEASVVCDQLVPYGESQQYDCRARSTVLTPRDLTTLMHAIGAVEATDLEDPGRILRIRESGAAGWVATAWASARQDDQRILVAPPKDTEDSIPTLESLVRLWAFIGPAQAVGAATVTGVEEGVKERIRSLSHDLASALVDSETHPDLLGAPDLLKRTMAEPFRVYEPGVLASDLGLRQTLEQLSFVPTDGYSPTSERLNLNELPWFKKDPGVVADTTYELSYYLLNAVLQSSEVRHRRFTYIALRGSLQWALCVVILFIALLVGWRYVAVRLWQGNPSASFMLPTLATQNPSSLPEDALGRSRLLIDRWIDTLPLIGLFGTVYGILNGLPNAGAVVAGTGPGAQSSINELFEQLGLAFSTTAIAIAGVILLQHLWGLQQGLEDAL
ncbi:MAG: MotA/TolQ/ExbB proton channel family protein [Acidobacteriota bacterium]